MLFGLSAFPIHIRTVSETKCPNMINLMCFVAIQSGFALLEVGSVKVTNVNEILLNNIMDFGEFTYTIILLFTIR